MIGIETITSKIRDLFMNTLQKPANMIPSIIMVCSLARRPGLSSIISLGRIAQNLSEEGIPTDKLPDGTPNLMLKFARAITREIYRSLKEDANIQVAIPSGVLNITTTGANAAGPVVSTGTNILPGKGLGLLQ